MTANYIRRSLDSKLKTLTATLISSLILTVGFAIAEEALTLTQKLIQDGATPWSFKRFEYFMGENDKCLEGEEYVFMQNDIVVVKQCVAGKILESRKKWHISFDNEIDIKLTMGLSQYLLIFYNDQADKNSECIILRKRSDKKTVQTIDKILCRNKIVSD